MAKDPDGPAPISDESIGFLEDVKKGKPRKFAMICKGTAVVSLVLYKKGSVEKYKKEAKQSGKGQFYFGVVDGKGMDIRFVLARADGFEAAPVKSTSLKGFLDESAELKCKPYFEIVDEAPLTLDADDPLVARFLALQASALQACEAYPERAPEINALCHRIGGQLDQQLADEATVGIATLETLLNGLQSAPTAPSNDPFAAKLVEELKQLKPLLEQAIAAHPQRKGELIASFTQIRDEIKAQQLASAQNHLEVLEKLLRSLIASQTKPEDEALPPANSEMALWKEKVAEWGPIIKAAISAKGAQTADLMKMLAQASALSKPGGDISAALVKLTECYELATQSTAQVDPAVAFNQRLKALLPNIKAAAGTAAGGEAKTMAAQAGALAQQKDFNQANQLLDRIADLLQSEGSTRNSIDPLVVWRDAKETVDAQLNKLTEAMRQSPHPYLQRVAELGLHGVTKDPSRIFVNMQASLFDLKNLQGEAKRQAALRVRQACQNYRQFVETSKLLEVFDTKGICGPMTIRKTLLDALAEVDRISAAQAS